jgi:drug/metabolite transporter superfamily protein YnfA
VVNVQAAGWFPDPMQRHQFRWWTGAGWSEHVSDGGVSGVDPLANQAPPQSTIAAQAPPPARSVPYQQAPQQVPYQPGPYQPGPYQPGPYQPGPYQQGAQPMSQPLPRQTLIAPPPAAAAVSAGLSVGWITLIGAVVAGVSTLLNWLDLGFTSANGFDVPVAFLVDYKTVADSSFTVGLVALVLAVVALAAAFVRQPAMRIAARVAGGLLVLVGLAYMVQMYRVADTADVSLSDLMGVGPLVAIVGGVTVLVAGGR